MKTFAKRDSATALLRKLGLAKECYNNYIEVKDGQFTVDVEAAAHFVSQATKFEESTKKVLMVIEVPAHKKIKTTEIDKNKKEVAAKDEAKKEVVRTVSSVAREMIIAGSTNAEIWSVLQAEFGLDDKKKGYPSWYRSQCRQNGLIK